ncbi:hypothetical protein TRVA0_013S02718 [Trichomonascus vanleenenianus]|uniref:uncharacterized protein n=1 Tax=Trichomonascus vanleenenianus TaxID=2268995 RepID=UPI003ECAB10B
MFYDTDEPLSRDEEMTLLHASQLPHLSQNYSFSTATAGQASSSLSASGSHSIERLLSEQTFNSSSSVSRSSGRSLTSSVGSGAVLGNSRTTPPTPVPPTTAVPVRGASSKTAAAPQKSPTTTTTTTSSPTASDNSNPRPHHNTEEEDTTQAKMKKPGLLKKLSMPFWKKKTTQPSSNHGSDTAERTGDGPGTADNGVAATRDTAAATPAIASANSAHAKESQPAASVPVAAPSILAKDTSAKDARRRTLTVRTTASEPARAAGRPESPILSSPATSNNIFERSVQEIYPQDQSSSPVQTPYHNEDFIPPALEASANAITDSSLDPNLIEVVSLRHQSPRSQSMTESITGSPTTPFYDISGYSTGCSSPTKLARDRAASIGLGVGAITPPHEGATGNRHILSFYSFADIVSAENVHSNPQQPLSPELSCTEPEDEVTVTSMKDTLIRNTGEISGQMVAA